MTADLQRYLVESYVPRTGETEWREAAGRARRVADELSRGGASIRYVDSLFVAEDETCFHVFEGSSVEAVAEASARAALAHVRIVSVRFVRRKARQGDAANGDR